MKQLLILMTFLLSIVSCRAWTPADQADYDKHCPKGSCSIHVTKESSTNYCTGTIVPIDCHKDNPNPGGTSRPGSGSENGSGNDDNSTQPANDACDGAANCPGGLGGSGLNPENDPGHGPGNGGSGGTLKGVGDTLSHWGHEIGKGWDGLKNELNGNNAENRRKKREAKRLLNEMQNLWAQAEGYGVAVADDRRSAEESWGLLEESWKEFGIASREKDLEEFRGRYNTRTRGILDGIPTPDPSVFDGMGKGRGDGIYPEHQKVANGRKYLEYARGKLDPNAADYGVRKTLLDFGDAALDEAEISYRAGNVVEGNAWYEIGMAAADAALSLTPGVGWAKDVYESITGKNLLTGKELTKFERGMAIAGALTGGIAKFGALAKAGNMIGVMATTAKTAQESEKITQAGKEAVEVLEAAAKTGARSVDDIKDLMVVAQGVDQGGSVAKGIDTVSAAKETADLSAKGPRKTPGVATNSRPLYNSEKMMRGTQGNAGLIPQEVAAKLEGKSFKDFDQFREKFWTAVSETKYANEFSNSNKTLMAGGNAPFAAKTQAVGERGLYEIHHITPIRVGGSVYDMSNMAIVTPRFHKEILERVYHYGK
ncbi:MAG TPA: pre-toxin TG domain-containing protein [Oligoflexus sp.]|uniref:pre-toxin TG domain-containing protein n=1 Tax=Oligoflexus sp. TaxID=1971216 RepID=UPI002D7EA620|nr:pre-toxin TG domain-containing protein [Oligoflexus sp.]HET9236147.1 pre-toxin TG domain-containing protein [Oligoflexus sp.]